MHGWHGYQAALFIVSGSLQQTHPVFYPSMLLSINADANANAEYAVASPSLDYLGGASGSRSMTYFPLATLMIGTPGIFRIRLFRSRSLVATM